MKKNKIKSRKNNYRGSRRIRVSSPVVVVWMVVVDRSRLVDVKWWLTRRERVNISKIGTRFDASRSSSSFHALWWCSDDDDGVDGGVDGGGSGGGGVG